MSLVDLTYRNSLLHGVVGAEPIRIAVAGRPNRASYAGTCSGHDFVLDLQVGSNHRNVNPTTELRGSYDGAPVELTGTVHLTPYFALRHVDITGTIGDHRVTAVVSSVEAPASGPAVLSNRRALRRHHRYRLRGRRTGRPGPTHRGTDRRKTAATAR